jgi:hypothetical protein
MYFLLLDLFYFFTISLPHCKKSYFEPDFQFLPKGLVWVILIIVASDLNLNISDLNLNIRPYNSSMLFSVKIVKIAFRRAQQGIV